MHLGEGCQLVDKAPSRGSRLGERTVRPSRSGRAGTGRLLREAQAPAGGPQPSGQTGLRAFGMDQGAGGAGREVQGVGDPVAVRRIRRIGEHRHLAQDEDTPPMATPVNRWGSVSGAKGGKQARM